MYFRFVYLTQVPWAKLSNLTRRNINFICERFISHVLALGFNLSRRTGKSLRQEYSFAETWLTNDLSKSLGPETEGSKTNKKSTSFFSLSSGRIEFLFVIWKRILC